jgi:predicted Zn finger-like uncharacterized protein
MQVGCKHCGKKYSLDDGKIPKRKSKFKCTQCQSYIYVYREKRQFNSEPEGGNKTHPDCDHGVEFNAKECPNCSNALEETNNDVAKQPSENINDQIASESKEFDKNHTKPVQEEKNESDQNFMLCRACWELIPKDVSFCPHCDESFVE